MIWYLVMRWLWQSLALWCCWSFENLTILVLIKLLNVIVKKLLLCIYHSSIIYVIWLLIKDFVMILVIVCHKLLHSSILLWPFHHKPLLRRPILLLLLRKWTNMLHLWNLILIIKLSCWHIWWYLLIIMWYWHIHLLTQWII